MAILSPHRLRLVSPQRVRENPCLGEPQERLLESIRQPSSMRRHCSARTTEFSNAAKQCAHLDAQFVVLSGRTPIE
jgi:hypothetical protein